MKIYSRKKQKAIVEDKKPEDPEEADDVEKGDGDLMQAMFDESVAMGDAFGDNESSSLADLDDLQEEYEQVIQMDDPDFIEDIFAANEIGEELCKSAIEKEKEAKKQESLEKEAAKKGSQPQKKEVVDEVTDKPVEPNQELLFQLKDMGFLEDLSKLALIKVKNENI